MLRIVVMGLVVAFASTAHADPSASELLARMTARYARAKRVTVSVHDNTSASSAVLERGPKKLDAQFFFIDGRTDFSKLTATIENPPGWSSATPSGMIRIDGPNLRDVFVDVDPTDGHIEQVYVGSDRYLFREEVVVPSPAPASANVLLARVASRYAQVKRYTARFSRGNIHDITSGSVDIMRGDKAIESWRRSTNRGAVTHGMTTIAEKDLPAQYLFMDPRVTLSTLTGTFELPPRTRTRPSTRMIKLDAPNVRDVYLVVDEGDAHVRGVLVGHDFHWFTDEVLDAPPPPTSAKAVLDKVIAHYAKARVLELELEFGGDERATGTATIDRRGSPREDRTTMRGGSGPNPPWTVLAVPGKDPVRFGPNRSPETLRSIRDSIWEPYAFFRDAAKLSSAKVTYLPTPTLAAIPFLEIRVDYGKPAKTVFYVIDPLSYRVVSVALPTSSGDPPRYAGWRISRETLDPPITSSTFVLPAPR